MDGITSKRASDQSSVPDLGKVGSTNSEEAEKTKVVGSANVDFIISNVSNLVPVQQYSNDFIEKFQSEGIGEISKQEASKIADLLDGSNKLAKKCSLNDIIFLVMMVMVKSTSEQRESRYDLWSDKKNIASKSAAMVYKMGVDVAKEKYDTTIKNLDMQRTMAWVTIGCSAVQLVLAPLLPPPSTIAPILNKISDVTKVSMATLRKMVLIAKVANIATQAVQSGMGIYQGAVGLNIAKKQKKTAFVQAELETIRSFVDMNINQLNSLKEAYRSSSKQVQSAVDVIRNMLERLQEQKKTVIRNV